VSQISTNAGILCSGRLPSNSNAMTVCGYKPKFRGSTEKVRFAPYSRLSNRDVGFRSGYVCLPLNS
jgi:hypothetical protein